MVISENYLWPLESLYGSNKDNLLVLVQSFCPQQPRAEDNLGFFIVKTRWEQLESLQSSGISRPTLSWCRLASCSDSPCWASFCSSSCLSCCRCSFILASSWLLPELRLFSLLAKASSRSRSRYTAFISAFSSLALLKSLPAPVHHRGTLSLHHSLMSTSIINSVITWG